MKLKFISFILFVFITSSLFSQKIIPFDSENWDMTQGKVVQYLGRDALSGTAKLNDIEFVNGIIEVDIAVTGVASYPEINFHYQNSEEYEHFYIRPHRSEIYNDVLQYLPVINGDKAWQLYTGENYTAGAKIPINEWLHIKIEVKDNQARVYLNYSEQASLKISRLYYGKNAGGISLSTSVPGTAYFSNFSVTTTSDLNFDEPEKEEFFPGVIKEWEISRTYKISKINTTKTPDQQELDNLKYQKVEADISGLVNIAKYRKRKGYEADCIYAKTIIQSEKDETMELQIGYSDAVAVFLNGQILFSGNSGYQQRDQSFLGIIGYNDMVYLPLKKGENELILLIAESFGGWGFQCRDGNAIYTNGLTKLWETPPIFKTSESVLYDSKREVLYVSNFDQFNMGNPNINQYISKISLQGEMIEKEWITGLNNPLGMCLHNDKLYIVERMAVVIVKPKTGIIEDKIRIPASFFLNDIAIDNEGRIYVSDTRKNTIWKYEDEELTEWLKGDEVSGPNALFFHDGKLIFGNSGDQYLKSVDIETKEISKIAKLDQGFIDGIRLDNNGNYLVSLWHGKIFRVSKEGEVILILNSCTPEIYSADFEYIKEKNLLIVPTFYGNTVVAYKLEN